MGEDQDWALRMLEAGYSIVYESHSVVLHSHKHTLAEKYDRSFQMGLSFSQFLSPILGRRRFPVGAWFVHLLLDLRFIPFAKSGFASKLKWLLLSPLHRAAMHYAYWRGWNSTLNNVKNPGVALPV